MRRRTPAWGQIGRTLLIWSTGFTLILAMYWGSWLLVL